MVAVERIAANLNETLSTKRYPTFIWGLASMTVVTILTVWKIQDGGVQITAIIALASYCGGAIGVGNFHDMRARLAKISAEKETTIEATKAEVQKAQLSSQDLETPAQRAARLAEQTK